MCLSDSHSMLPPTYGNSFPRPFLIHLKPRTWLWRWVILDGLLKRLLTVSANPGSLQPSGKKATRWYTPASRRRRLDWLIMQLVVRVRWLHGFQ